MDLLIYLFKQYVIVEFPEESKDGNISMALISSSWIFEDNGVVHCYWPAYLKSTLSREKAIKNHTPLTLNKCMTCAVVVKYTDTNYSRAIEKLKNLEDESEQSSVTDAESNKGEKVGLHDKNIKTKISQKYRDFHYYGDTDDSENEIPLAPKLPTKTYTTLQPMSSCSSRFQTLNQSEAPLVISSSPLSTDNRTPKIDVNVKNKCQCQCEKILEKQTNLLERVLRDLQIVKSDTKTILQMSSVEKQTSFEALDSDLKFSEYEELEDFNNKLENADYFNKLQSSVCLLGGRDLADTTRKIASILMNQNLELKINWIGANNKGSLQKLSKVLQLIYVTVRRNPICANSTNSEIDQALKNWIKNAPDRAGGRSKRDKKKDSQNELNN